MKKKRLLLEFIRSTWYIYLSSVMLHMVASVIYVFFPHVLGEFTDLLKGGQMTGADIVHYSWLLLAIGAGHAILGGVGQYLVMYVGRLFEFMTRRRLFTHFTGLSEHFHSRNGVGKLLSYFMNDVTSVRESISMGVNQTAMATMLFVSSIVAMVVSGIPTYLIMASVGPLILIPWIVTKFGPAIRKRSMRVQEALGTMTESAEEQFGGIRVTKKFAVEPIMIGRFEATVDRIRDNQLKLVRLSSLFQALVPFLGSISLVVAIAYGGYLTIEGKITLGNFVALTLYVRMLMNPLQQIGNVINTMQRSRASLERLNELLAKMPDIVESKDAVHADLSTAEIRIRGLTFTYPEEQKEALSNIDLDIKPGTTLGIVGRTGSGKTTLVKLLLRVYDPPAGTIFADERDIRELTLDSLRTQIAYVPQDGFLFSTTIRENIAFSRRDSGLEEVENAAKQAQIYGNIVEFPERFETKLGERGVTLSGGQRQRTSLARGMLKNAPVMILDDSVSAVDAVTETDIIHTIREERAGKTTILIAHRISALKHADEIVVLDRGAIVQRGTHEELLSQPGIYATIHAIQEEGSQHASSH
ncbi:ABC transporter ATP-binding protein [Cohnella lupini]|uniref:ATP-binding cassette subfamily B protein n=1 Tax=Cohnella lupini TaxID=1294267 RepID=A0A3D9IN62_9BACL|nr:ABC transporter ATP-binding protein [Cohnella lupini]RED63151.1 ATP-binding cassette subfamily B protein [Cohnella lupini]